MKSGSPSLSQRGLVALTLTLVVAMAAGAVAILQHAHATGALALETLTLDTLVAGGTLLLLFRLCALVAVLRTDVELLVSAPFEMEGTNLYGHPVLGLKVCEPLC
jgi:hypothetical protein